MEEDWKVEGIEAQNLRSFNLQPHMLSPTLWKFRPPRQLIDHTWKSPQVGFLKLNFDGVSKGNPGQAGIGGIFCNSN